MSSAIIQDIIFLVCVIGLGAPIGKLAYKIMEGGKIKFLGFLRPVELCVYRAMGVDENRGMSGKQYATAALLFSLFGLIFLIALLMCQGFLPFNPEELPGLSWDLAYNTAASFVSNTNWQAYSGETTLSYLSQFLGLTVQNFVSAATGIAVLFALIRGFILKKSKTIGNFWCDLVRTVLYLLLPLSLIVAIILMSQGVVQTLAPYAQAALLEGGGSQVVPLGPAASQIAIKQLGTNGGGFFGVNSAFPLENPTAISNFVECWAIIVIPAALCFTFGKAVKDSKQGRSILTAMTLVFIIALTLATMSEYNLGPQFNNVAASASIEGKEVRFGAGGSALWGVTTTAASNGSVNSMHDSFTPLGGMFLMFMMQLGEIIFGGVGSGLYAMLAFAVLAIFIAGLMVGRTPEYLGKKIEPFDMKMTCTIILVPPLLILGGTAIATMMPQASDWLTNGGAHGFSEILYAYTSGGANNGSAFAGYAANNVFNNVMIGSEMLLVRFIPMVAVVRLGANLASKKAVPKSDGTLSTTGPMFVGLLIGVFLIIGALSFLPALALGPIADYFTML